MNYLDGLNTRQKEAAQYLEGPLLIVAGAGAGKTKTITHRIAHCNNRLNFNYEIYFRNNSIYEIFSLAVRPIFTQCTG